MIFRLTPHSSSFSGSSRRACRGFTYLGVLFAVFFIGVALAATGTVWQQTRQREKENELLFIGAQFRQALEAYYQNPPAGKARKFPQTLEQLLRDERFPDVRRYLRRIYRDPMTGEAEWGLLRGADQSIVGLYSLSQDEPLKKDNFDSGNELFAGKRHYAEWQFIAAKGGAVAGGANVVPTGQDVIPPSGQPESPSREESPQNQPSADVSPSPPNEPHQNLSRNAACQAEFLRMRTACRAAGGDCLRLALTQYTQCLK